MSILIADILFAPQGGADRVLIYLTLFISACLARIEKAGDVKNAEKVLQAYAWESITLPGEKGKEKESCRLNEKNEMHAVSILIIVFLI